MFALISIHPFSNYKLHLEKRKLCNIYGGTEMMDNIYEEYESMNEFEKKSLDGLPSLGKAVNNSIVYIMDETLNPQKVYLIR